MVKAVLAGIAGTIVMTIFMMIGAAMGMPEMNPPQMLAGMMDTSVVVGWIMHFMIGIIFALIYVYLISNLLKKVSNLFVKGLIFGVIAFIIAQVALPIMGSIFGEMPPPEGSMILMAMASLVGHMVFGVVVALVAKE